jgi:hypothetical protein
MVTFGDFNDLISGVLSEETHIIKAQESLTRQCTPLQAGPGAGRPRLLGERG